jgi:hypothetical protein
MSTFQELCEAAFAGKIIQMQVRLSDPEEWADLTESPEKTINRIVKFSSSTYRIKPDTKVITYRAYLRKQERDVEIRMWDSGLAASKINIQRGPYFIKWLGDEQTIEVEL